MILIEESNNKDLSACLAQLHKKSFKGFFLTQLGNAFLKTLYRGYFEDESSGVIIAKSDEQIVGFIAYSKDYPAFFKNLVKKHIIRFAFCSVRAAFLHPSFIKRLLGAFKKSEEVTKSEKYVELASICVDPDCEGKGIGTALIDKLKSTVDFGEYAFINLETDAENNDAVNKFYVKNGFKLTRSFCTGEGRLMNEYIFKPRETV